MALSPPSGYVARYRADTEVTDAAGVVSAWGDMSANGYDLAQATADNRPTLVAGSASTLGERPLIRFDGTNDYLSRATTPAVAQDLTIVVIGVSNAADQGEFICNAANGNGASIFCRTTGASYVAYAGASGCQGSTVAGTEHLFEAYFNGSGSILRVDSVVDASGNAGTLGLAGIRVGASPAGGGANFLDGDIYEIIVYDAELTHAQRGELARYASQRYGFAIPFPQVVQTVESSFPVASTNHNVNMPTTTKAGELLLVSISPAVDFGVVTPSGWTKLGAGAYAKVANGTEGSGTVNFVSLVSVTGAAQAFRIAMWSGSLSNGVKASSTANDSGNDPNPSSLAPGWGSLNTLWLALAAWTDDDETVSSYPASYSNGVDTISGAGANAGAAVGSARRELAAALENPGAFTLSGSEAWVARTIAIKPIPNAPPLQGGSGIMAGCL